MRLGLLDIGSAAARLELVDLDGARLPRATASFKARTRLAEHTRPDGEVTEQGIRGAVRAVRGCMAKATAPDLLVAYGTSAVRDAANAPELLEVLSEAAAVRVQVLSPRAEAALTFHAARRWSRLPGDLTTVDIGGGTADVARGIARYPDEVVTFPFGAASLTRQYLPDDPPRPHQVDELVAVTQEWVWRELRRYRDADLGRPIGQSKVLRQLAALTGSAQTRHPRTLARGNLRRWIPHLAVLSRDERAALPGVSRSRARRILAGAIVAESILATTGIEELEMCPWGLREGLVLRCADAYERAARRGMRRRDTVKGVVEELFATSGSLVSRSFGGPRQCQYAGRFDGDAQTLER